jgi:hypothetical protein
LQKSAHRDSDFLNVRLEGEMSGIKELNFASGRSFRNAFAPAGMKNGSFLPQIASKGGFELRKYS